MRLQKKAKIVQPTFGPVVAGERQMSTTSTTKIISQIRLDIDDMAALLASSCWLAARIMRNVYAAGSRCVNALRTMSDGLIARTVHASSNRIAG
jgi:hypothetical protein